MRVDCAVGPSADCSFGCNGRRNRTFNDQGAAMQGLHRGALELRDKMFQEMRVHVARMP
jgi:hypothetical protein